MKEIIGDEAKYQAVCGWLARRAIAYLVILVGLQTLLAVLT